MPFVHLKTVLSSEASVKCENKRNTPTVLYKGKKTLSYKLLKFH